MNLLKKHILSHLRTKVPLTLVLIKINLNLTCVGPIEFKTDFSKVKEHIYNL